LEGLTAVDHRFVVTPYELKWMLHADSPQAAIGKALTDKTPTAEPERSMRSRT
jgi:hypothetical protein